MRTVESITANQSEWVKNTNSNRKKLKHFKNCEFKPIPMQKSERDKEVIFTFPPDPLHVNLLGPVNDVLSKMEQIWPLEMESFYSKNHLKKCGEGPGGQFNGPSIKYIIQERSLICLQAMVEIQTDLIKFIEYLRAIAQLHLVCTSVEVPETAELVLNNFSEKFEILKDKFALSETLKIHVIKSHYCYYFRQTNTTLRHTNGEFTESAHSTLRKSEELHGF